MKLMNRVRRDSFPLWEITAAEPDFFEPTHLIRVKVKKPLSENSHIKVKGNSIGDGQWRRMQLPYYYIKDKRYKVTNIDEDICALMVRVHARVRVPALEEQYKDELNKLHIKEYRKVKQGG